VGHQQEDIEAWRARNNIDVTRQIKLVKISHMRYQHPDLEEITRFLEGMGHQTRLMGTADTSPRFWYDCRQEERYRCMVSRIRPRPIRV
jgi:hypothetical protein